MKDDQNYFMKVMLLLSRKNYNTMYSNGGVQNDKNCTANNDR